MRSLWSPDCAIAQPFKWALKGSFMAIPHPLSVDLENLFSQFRRGSPQDRKQMLDRIEYLLTEIRGKSDSAYVKTKCTSLFVVCKNMSRLRQPSDYDESRESSLALGDISVIQDNFTK